MDKIAIGQQTTVTLKFRPPYPQFSTAPRFEVLNPNSQIVLSGFSILSVTDPDAWDVTFTIPTTYKSLTDNDVMMVELFGTDSKGVIRSVERSYELIDSADDFLPSIVLGEDNEDIEDSFILPIPDIDADSIKVTVQDYLGKKYATGVAVRINKVMRVANQTDVPDRFTEHEFRGYRYDVSFPGLTFPPLTRAPYQLLYTINSVDVPFKEKIVHPFIRLESRFYDYINSVKMYLDKARLIEIDPTLQWHTDEIANGIIEGLDYINSSPTVITYWTVEDSPRPLAKVVQMAAAMFLLNTRYLAEGFNAFQFQGLSTTLDMDRRDTITYKIEELKGWLDTNLTNFKSIAISSFGKGTPDASIKMKEARAILRTQPSPVHNRYGYTYGNSSRQRAGKLLS